MSAEIVLHVQRLRWRTRVWRWLCRIRPDGTKPRPYPTFRSAVKAIPLIIPPNTRYVIDTGVDGPSQ